MTIIFDEDKKNQQLKQMKIEEDERLMMMLSDRYSIPYINLSSVSINTDALRLLDQEEAKKSMERIIQSPKDNLYSPSQSTLRSNY